MLRSNQLQIPKKFLFLFVVSCLVSSCCDFHEPTLTELKICDVNKDDLDKSQCDTDNASLSNDAPFITASVKAYRTNPTDRIVFKLYDETTGELVSELGSSVTEIAADAKENQCLVQAAASLPRRSDVLWPDANLRVEVVLENNIGTPITLTKRFTIR